MRVNWALLPTDMEALIGQVVAGRYAIDDVLGVGGMGAVFQGRHLLLERDVAIKMLRPEYAQHEEISARFDREARSASSFDHPNCVQVIDFGTSESGMKFMVMPLLRGTSLVERLGRPFPAKQAVEMCLEILAGLEHAHGKGVIHRDLKPENVFITRDHTSRVTLKIVDFGIAKLSGRADGIVTRMGSVFGTPHYMSPEQALGQSVDERADLYAVGVILYQLLTGQLPFDDADARKLMRKQIENHPPGPPPFVPSSLRTILGKLLAKRPDFRYASATEAITALRSAGNRLPPDRVQRLPLLQDGVDEARAPTEAMHAGAPAAGFGGVAGRLEKLLHQETPLALEALHDGIGESREPWNIDIDSLDLDDLGEVAEATQRRR